jgi:hypothetical protein
VTQEGREKLAKEEIRSDCSLNAHNATGGETIIGLFDGWNYFLWHGADQ